jgi:hypothetical protein
MYNAEEVHVALWRFMCNPYMGDDKQIVGVIAMIKLLREVVGGGRGRSLGLRDAKCAVEASTFAEFDWIINNGADVPMPAVRTVEGVNRYARERIRASA